MEPLKQTKTEGKQNGRWKDRTNQIEETEVEVAFKGEVRGQKEQRDRVKQLVKETKKKYWEGKWKGNTTLTKNYSFRCSEIYEQGKQQKD